MNWDHLGAVLWLRWRILANRIKRANRLLDALFALIVVLCVVASLAVGVIAYCAGFEELPGLSAATLMKVWGYVAIGFLFFWMIGLLTDLQRSDAMSFKNLLHLPVSLEWVFLYNYLSSFVSLSIAIFLPAMLGLSLAMVTVHGPKMAWSLVLVLAFFGMITALTYQLRGWLARLMENKRRGRSVVTVVTIVFVLLVQLPNLINLGVSKARRAEREARIEREEEGLSESPTTAGELEAERESHAEQIDRYASLAAMILPIGWLPYGVRSTFEGRWLASGLCLLGMLSIGAWSLRRSFSTTLAGVLGTGSGGPTAASEAPPGQSKKPRTPLAERNLPGVSDSVSAIACGSLQSLLRAPEAKLLLLGPVIMLGFFVFMLSGNPLAKGSAFGPLIVLGATTMGLVSIAQLIQNQFGMDRAGFRAYVLSPVPRERFLLGKNLATAPLGLGIGLVTLIGLESFLVLDVSHFVGACFQLVSAYLILCMIGNTISILAPMRLKEHTLKAERVGLKAVLCQLIALVLIPLCFAPLLIPAGAEFLLREEAWAQMVPLYLILHGFEAGMVYLAYRWLVRRQGEALQQREQRILDVLTRE